MVSTSNHALATILAMHIECLTNRVSPPAVLLRESFRHQDKVKKFNLADLSRWPCPLVEGLTHPGPRSKLVPARSLPSETRAHPFSEELGIEEAEAREPDPATDWLLQRRTASGGTFPPST